MRRLSPVRSFAPSAACLVLAIAGALSAGPLAPPTVEPPSYPLYGDDQCVARLVELLDDPDPRVRERAVADLAATDNLSAAEHIAKAADDPHPHVRRRACHAALSMDAPVVRRALVDRLADDRPTVTLAALRAVRRLKLADAAQPARRLLAGDQPPAVTASTLRTLTALGVGAEPAELVALLDSPSSAVRLGAADNAPLAGADDELVSALARRARADAPAVRGSAIAALGALARASYGELIAAAATDAHPALRAGAVNAYRASGERERLEGFLSDESAMVRLAAIRAAGATRCSACADELVQRMLARPADSHAACVASLRAIGGQAVAQSTTRTLAQLIDAIGDDPSDLLLRNLSACCRVLGGIEAEAGLDEVIRLLGVRPIDLPPLADAAWAAGEIGDRRAIPALRALLSASQANAAGYLQSKISPATSPPYNEQVVRQTLLALAKLQADELRPAMEAIINTRARSARLNRPAAGVGEAIVLLHRAGAPAEFGDLAEAVLADESFSVLAQYWSCMAAGELKADRCLDELKTVLTQRRPDHVTIRASAWAIQQITGRAPELTDPQLRQGTWMVEKLRR